MSLYLQETSTQSLIESKDWTALANQLAKRPISDAGAVLVQLDNEQRLLLAQRLAHQESATTVAHSVTKRPHYLETTYAYSIKKRIGWLIVLMIGQMGTASVMDYFDNELEKALVLALFIPMIISCGGNSGSQASTLIIRAMAVGQVNLGDWFRVIYRESITGIMIGVILGIIAFLRILVVNDQYGEFWLYIGLTVSLSTAAVVVVGSILGSVLPLLLKALKADPATSSAPFVATLADVCGLILYFLIAISLLGGKLI
ncbi:MAG: magnesium transporter [Halieaceae bacterium]